LTQFFSTDQLARTRQQDGADLEGLPLQEALLRRACATPRSVNRPGRPQNEERARNRWSGPCGKPGSWFGL
jgi:hypothetical protein